MLCATLSELKPVKHYDSWGRAAFSEWPSGWRQTLERRYGGHGNDTFGAVGMSSIPKAVIHINFLPGELLFDARPIWTVLNKATRKEKVSTLSKSLGEQLGAIAIHLGTRDYMLRAAIRELNAATKAIWDFVPTAVDVGSIPNTRVMRGRTVEVARDRVLLATDSFLYECRSFLELLARLTYEMLVGIRKKPAPKQQLSTGQTSTLIGRGGKLRTHDFLLFLCDQTHVAADWFLFLSSHRNVFTHKATPYCAVEETGSAPAEYDLLIMRTTILDFSSADPKNYFRSSECAAVGAGLRRLGGAVQKHLVDLLR